MITVIIIGCSVATFTGLLLLTKRPLATSDAISAAFMLLLVLPMLEKLVLDGTIGLPYFVSSLFLGSPLTFGPFLYLYTQSVIAPGSLRKPTFFIHYLPFLVLLGIFLAQTANKPSGSITGQAPGSSLGQGLITIDALIILSFVVYTAKIFIMLRAHSKRIPDYFSKDTLAINLKWLGWITAAFFLAYMLVIGSQVFPVSNGIQILESSVIRDIGTVFFIIVFGFCTIKQPVVFKVTPEESRESTPHVIEDPALKKYEKSGLKERDALEYLAVLEEYMHSRKPWLDPDLTIEQVATALNIQKHYLTQIINERLDKNFYRYVNEYRIAEVKQKIAGGEAARLTLLGIALDCGFNSKSAFNNVFKKITDITPSEYRKSVLL